MRDNIFKNMNTVVEKFSTTPGAPRTGTENCEAQMKLETFKAARESADIQRKLAKVEKDERLSELNGKVIGNIVNATMINNALKSATDKCKETLFINIFEDIFKKALLIDEDFVTEQSDTIHNIIVSYVRENGGFDMVNKAIAHTDSALLREMKSVCEKCANKVAKRNMKKVKETNEPNDIDFSLTSEEEDEFDCDKAKLTPDEIAKLVKDKVFTVIRDEKERQANEDELIADIEEELKNDDNIKDEKAAKEALNRILTGRKPVEETTLFNAIFRNVYNEYLVENIAAQQYTVQQNDEKHEEDAIAGDVTVDDIIGKSADLDDANCNDDDIKKINMDLVLAEAIASYTLMETVYTLRLEDFSYQNIRSLANRLVKPITESKNEDEDKTSSRKAYEEVRKEFFKYFNKIKDLDDVEDNQEKINDMMDDLSSDKMEYFIGCVKAAINQIEDVIDKNEDKKDEYDKIIDWLEGIKTGKKPQDDEDEDDDKKDKD